MKAAVRRASLFVVMTASTVSADTYPSKPITVIVPYAAGGSTDAAMRLVAEKMKVTLKVPVIIENKPGAGSTVGAATTARAPKDGYTLGVITQSTAAIAPHLYEKVDYTLDSFAPISQITRVPLMVMVRKGLPVTTPREFVDYIIANKPAAYGTPGAGTVPHLLGMEIGRTLKVEFTHVPYRGNAPAVSDLLSGSLDIMLDALGPLTLAQHKAGLLRVIGVFGEERLGGFPNIPTFKESGFPSFVGESYTGIVAPAGTPATVIKQVNEAVRMALADPDIAKKLLEAGTPAQSSTPEEFDARMRRDYQSYGNVMKAAELPKLQ